MNERFFYGKLQTDPVDERVSVEENKEVVKVLGKALSSRVFW